jgi:HK97 family phage major capsid protein
MTDQLISVPTKGTTIKALGEGRVGGYLVVWGNPQQRDLQGEYFTKDTDFKLDWYGSTRPMLYHHAMDGTIKSTTIGVIDAIKADEIGLWAEAQLHMRDKYVQAVSRLIQKGVLGWSSGSAPNLVEISNDGQIKTWALLEGSATPTPAEPRNTGITHLKSYTALVENDPTVKELLAKELLEEEETDDVREADNGTNSQTSTEAKGTPPSPTPERKGTMLTKEQIEMIMAMLIEMGIQLSDDQKTALAQRLTEDMQQQTVADASAVSSYLSEDERAKMTDEAKAKAEKLMATIVQNAYKAITTPAQPKAAPAGLAGAFKSAFDQPQSRVSGGYTGGGSNGSQSSVRIEVRTKFADMSAEDMSYYNMLLNAERRKKNLPNVDLGQEFYRELADKATKSVEKGSLKLDRDMVKSINAIKADELNHSTQTNYGDEWVPELWATQIWSRVRQDNVVAPLFRNIDMPSNPYKLPVESSDPTVYHVPETTDENQLALDSVNTPIPGSKVGSANVTIEAKKLALRVQFSAELEEDGIIPIISIYREQAMRSIADSVDFVLLNGDEATGANVNINKIDGTPGGKDRYTAFDGLLKNALVTNTANALDCGGSITLAKMNRLRFLLKPQYAQNPKNLVYVVDNAVYEKLLMLPEFLTMDKAGNLATAMTGQIGFIGGVPVLTTAEMPLANAAGKVPVAGGTLGRAMCIHKPTWYVGYKRRVSVTVDYLPYYDSYQLVSTVRLGMVVQDEDSVSALFNIAVN